MDETYVCKASHIIIHCKIAAVQKLQHRYSSNIHIIAKHVDIYIVVGDAKCAISIILLLLTR